MGIDVQILIGEHSVILIDILHKWCMLNGMQIEQG